LILRIWIYLMYYEFSLGEHILENNLLLFILHLDISQ
jgi:hypothetical protein